MFHQISLIRFYIRIYYHWDDSYFKSSYLEVFCKIVVRKNSVKFTGKHLRWRRLSGTVTGYGKRKPSLYFFPWILRPFQTSIVVHLSSTVSAVWYAVILLSQSFFGQNSYTCASASFLIKLQVSKYTFGLCAIIVKEYHQTWH